MLLVHCLFVFCFVRVSFCCFTLPLGVGDWLRFVIVALPGFFYFSNNFFIYISQLIRFARVSNHVADFNTRNKILTAKLLKQGYQSVKFFSKFYRCHYKVLSKFNTGLRSLLKQGLLELEFYGDLVYKLKIVSK